MKKHRDYEDEMNEATKAKEVTAYEDSWYRSLKALADMRPTETDARHAPEPEPERAAAEPERAAAEEVQPRAEDVQPTHDARPVHSDEETPGVPED